MIVLVDEISAVGPKRREDWTVEQEGLDMVQEGEHKRAWVAQGESLCLID